MSKSKCFTDYSNCIGDPLDILNNLNCAADLRGCLREVVMGADLSVLDEPPGAEPPSGGGIRGAEFGGGATAVERPPTGVAAASVDMLRMPTAEALARLPETKANAVRDSINIINALRGLSSRD